MNTVRLRNVLMTAGVTALIGIGVSACGESVGPPQGESGKGVAGAASDDAITFKVQARLANESGHGASDLIVTTRDGVVTLEGTVDDAGVRLTAERTALSVHGVSRVDNRLVSTATNRSMKLAVEQGRDAWLQTVAGTQEVVSDGWITTRVKAELLADSLGTGVDVRVKTHDGMVRLSGTVSDEQAMDRIVQVARGVAGVVSVDSSAMFVENSANSE